MTYAIKDLNKEAAAHDLELVKGDGYFYWVHPERVDIPSVYVAAFSHADRAFWEAELTEAAYGAEAPPTEAEKRFFCQSAQWGSDRIAQIEANIADLEARLARGERRPSMNNMHVSGGRFVRDDEIKRCINWNRLALRDALEKAAQ